MHYFAALFSSAFYTTPFRFMIPAWIIWALSWWAAALWSKRAASSASITQEIPYRLFTVLGVFVLFGIIDFHLPGWSVPTAIGWILFALVIAGFAWCCRTGEGLNVKYSMYCYFILTRQRSGEAHNWD